MSFFAGNPAEYEQVSNLTGSQMRGQRQLEGAAQGGGRGGAFGQAGDYYRSILNNDPQSINQLFAPEMRQFRENVIPGLAEQFAGMGAGGLSSSGFRNAAQYAGTDLAERLAYLRSQLRQNAAQGLMGLGQQSLTPHSQWMQTQQAQPGLLQTALPAIAGGIGLGFGAPFGGALSSLASNKIGSWFNPSNGGNAMPGSTSPYGSVGSQGNFNPSLIG